MFLLCFISVILNSSEKKIMSVVLPLLFNIFFVKLTNTLFVILMLMVRPSAHPRIHPHI